MTLLMMAPLVALICILEDCSIRKIPHVLPDWCSIRSSFPGPYRRTALGSVGLWGSVSSVEAVLRVKKLKDVLIYLVLERRMD